MRVTSRHFSTVGNIETTVRALNDVEEYLAVVRHFQDEYGYSRLWYRGVSRASYSLIPKVYRDRLWERHENFEWWLMTDFTHRARRFISDSHSYSEWDWYFTMQHYGMPTRLLDWTRGSLIGLYFAVRNPGRCRTPSVYILNPYWIDEVVNGTEEGLIYNTDIDAISDEQRDLLCSYLDSRKEAPAFPLCVEPPSIHERISAQESVFTIHGKYIDAFRILGKRHADAQIARIRFSTKQALHIRDELAQMGITEGTLFPGLEGIVKDIQCERGLIIEQDKVSLRGKPRR